MELNTLLQRAQNLANSVYEDCELPRMEPTLQQVLQAADEFHARVTQTGGKDIQAHILLGSKGINLPKLNQKLEALNARKTFEPLDVTRAETDISTFLKNERENAITSVIEDTNKNINDSVTKQKWTHLMSSWNEEKTRLLDALIGSSQNFIDLQRLPQHTVVNPESMPRSCLNRMELLYAQELRQYNELIINQSPQRPNLVQKFEQLVQSFGDLRLTDMWNLLTWVTQVDQPFNGDPIKTRQQRPEFVLNAKSYLERRYRLYLSSILMSPTDVDSYQLVLAYVTRRFGPHQSTIGLVDVVGGGKPLWPLVYYSLRCGSVETALEFLREAGTTYDDFSLLISDRVNSRIESQLKLQYANKIKNSTDAYKKAVYCIFLGCDPHEVHGEVAKSIDDFLWIKLSMLRPGTPELASGFSNLQSLILEKYGEKYFNASQQAHLYFQTLALTGQFEAAIEFLSRSDENRVHAVHMAIALQELGFLGGVRSVNQPLLSIDISDPQPLRRLNLSRLIRLYVGRFKRTDTVEALHYYYTLRCLRDPKGRNMFLTCVCDLIVESGVLDTSIFELIFGRRENEEQQQPNGLHIETKQGLFREFHCPEFDTGTMAGLVADELVERGSFEMAVPLYDMAGKHNLALKHLSILLAQVVHEPPSVSTLRSRLSLEAKRFTHLLETQHIELDPKVESNYVLLQDLLIFFDNYHEGKFTMALQQLWRTNLIPREDAEVDGCLAHIKSLSGEVIKVLPDVMIATMDITQKQYKQFKADAGQRTFELRQLKERAKLLANMTAIMPYRMPHDTNRRLLQLELMMH